ncbi:MAG TPA: ATP-binding protein, partial [Nitrososphaeraceae archaeon]|nr:ATP-binding protein [Nitrososphaeraceae archaeon]
MKLISIKNYFQPRARLLLQLGDKLIKNENIALLELIKNSYDADSRKVIVKLENVTDKQKGRITIIDDGSGMDIKIIEDAWLEPGSDYKEQLFLKRVRTKKYKRLPIGEKGIGRFGVHKLGNKIELISKMEGKNEIVVKIDWTQFAQNKYLKDAKFEVFERHPEYFLRDRTGTR